MIIHPEDLECGRSYESRRKDLLKRLEACERLRDSGHDVQEQIKMLIFRLKRLRLLIKARDEVSPM